MRLGILGLIIFGVSSQALADGRLWVTADRLNRRTCPSIECGVVGKLFFREGVQVLEQRGQWARISKMYDASCENGRSVYVDKGNSSCKPGNGITNGLMAEWVSTQHLSNVRPADPAAGLTGLKKAIASSDDFHHYSAPFERAANQLIKNGRCMAADFEENGGWLKSTNHYKDVPVYFIYCGGVKISNRLYLNALTGQVYK